MSEIIHEIYPVEKGAFETAGEASGTIKRMLRKLGVPSPCLLYTSDDAGRRDLCADGHGIE